ncbi:c-type cytochrome [Maribacter sp. X9]|uniref:c-type cytochrome n=1 Tax=Maribacter sp. X9 TaxID=3402159 RepID=UPI003AF3384A
MVESILAGRIQTTEVGEWKLPQTLPTGSPRKSIKLNERTVQYQIMRNILFVILILPTFSYWMGPVKNFEYKSMSEAISMLPIISSTARIEGQEKAVPRIKLALDQANGSLTWGDFVRYSIEVSDTIDGDSKYCEIPKNKVLLEIEFLPAKKETGPNKKIEATKKEADHDGLSLMMGSTCFSCHGDKEIMTGPSFSEIAERYGKNPKSTKLLAGSILSGSEGKWSNIKMPANPGLSVEETEKIAAFILAQGSRKHHWIITGLEGTFQIIKKPANISEGTYVLTASYTSSSSMKGQNSISLQIR